MLHSAVVARSALCVHLLDFEFYYSFSLIRPIWSILSPRSAKEE